MIVGENARAEEMDVNPTKEKKLTNMRSSDRRGARAADRRRRSSRLEQALEFCADDECVEVTPDAVRCARWSLARPSG